VNALIYINGSDVTDSCLLSATRITADSSKRITTASITIMGQSLTHAAQYDSAHYDQDHYSLDLRELYLVTILDGSDGTTKLFEGQIYAFNMAQSDGATFGVFYQCDLSDYAAWLDRSVCWGNYTLTLPNSDQGIIQALLGQFCPRINVADVAQLVPVIQKYDWQTKTSRQVLDDMQTLAGAEWHVDFDGKLHYGPASNAPLAPFNLSTSPDMIMSFPVKVSGYKHDFNNPINRAFVRASVDLASAAPIEASYSDPISIQKYGTYDYAVVDTQITTSWDASLRAKSMVLKYANPLESGSFTIWKDGLKLGQQVNITEENLGINGAYIIRQMTMAWEDKYTVRYEAQFGAAQPDLDTVLRIMAQRSAWSSALAVSGTSVPAPGSVSDASIAQGGLSANVINSVNAGSIVGKVTAGQINSVNAGAILGQVSAGQIGSVAAGVIQGSLQADHIGSVYAGTIQGVVVSSQLADQIIDNLAKYAQALVPVQMVQNSTGLPSGMPNKNFPANSFFYYVPDGHFYRITADGMNWVQNDSPQNALMNFYYIGAINAQSIIGLIVAAQIQTITAGQITGQIQAGQISSVNASSINGQITAGQILTVNATAIQGLITSDKIQTITAGQITGTLSAGQINTIQAGQITGLIAYNQIGSVNASTITIGVIQDGQIGSINGTKLNIGSVTSDKFDGYSINVGGGGNKPGRINVYNSGGSIIAQVGTLDSGFYGGWFQVLAASGTGYGDAKFKTDTSGNLTITDANLTVNGGGGKVYTSPTTFDPTYSTVAWIAEGGSDKCSHISRGLVFYSSNSKIGSIVRSPSGTWMELEFPTPGYVLISGSGGGTVRADGGFGVAGAAGVSGSFVAGAKTVTVTKGIITSIV
jgi:hypothetical protein